MCRQVPIYLSCNEFLLMMEWIKRFVTGAALSICLLLYVITRRTKGIALPVPIVVEFNIHNIM